MKDEKKETQQAEIPQEKKQDIPADCVQENTPQEIRMFGGKQISPGWFVDF